MREAVGMVEVYGLVAAFAACDAGCKAADVRVENFDKNKPGDATGLPVPLLILVKFRGSIEAVTAAVEAAEEAANRISGVSSKRIIASFEADAEPMLKLNCFDKN